MRFARLSAEPLDVTGTRMDIGHTVAVKAFIFGGTLPIATLLVSKVAPEWLAWGIGATVWTALFHWLPPRIHRGLTPARSALLCLAAGVLAALITLAVDRLFA